jgi:hypothetical protein
VPPVLVAERDGEQEVGDRRKSLGGESRRAGGSDAGDPRDGVAETESSGAGYGLGGRQVTSGAWNVNETSPNLSTSPFWTAMGTPVATRFPLT